MLASSSGSCRSTPATSGGFISTPSRYCPPLDAEDVLQEANLVLWRKFDQYQEGTNFFAWACQIIRYEVLKYQ